MSPGGRADSTGPGERVNIPFMAWVVLPEIRLITQAMQRIRFVVYSLLSRGNGDQHGTECRAETHEVTPPLRRDDGGEGDRDSHRSDTHTGCDGDSRDARIGVDGIGQCANGTVLPVC